MTARMLIRWFAAIVLLAGPVTAQAQKTFEELKLEGAKYYSERSYALAYETWREAAALNVPDDERRKLEFYLADALWRSKPGAVGIQEARESLAGIIEQNASDVLAAEALESLGDSWLALGENGDGSDWPKAWTFYAKALDLWAASTELDLARTRYLGIVWKATGPPTEETYGRSVPLEVLANALEIAVNPENKARAHYFLGDSYWQRGDVYSVRRAGREWETALQGGQGTAVYQAALFRLAEWAERAGRSEWDPEGGLRVEPDFARALELYRRFLQEFPRGSSPFSDAAASRVEAITTPSLELVVANLFLPGTPPEVSASWRNLSEVEFVVSRVNLATAFKPSGSTSPYQWASAISLEGSTEIRRWKEAASLLQPHAEEARKIQLDELAEAGAYIVDARSGNQAARALILVTEATAVVQPVGLEAVAYVAQARTGLALNPDGLQMWRVQFVDDEWNWTAIDPTSTSEKLVRYSPDPASSGPGDWILMGSAENQPVTALVHGVWNQSNQDDWRVHIITDRPIYRPTDPVRWKLTARKRVEGAYATPAGQVLSYTILDPRGETVDTGELKLTSFGTAWGSFQPDPKATLGEYRMEISENGDAIASEVFFRLEEYRVPEFKVELTVPTVAATRMRLGEPFVVKADAEFYFGGAVSDARVEFVVREAAYQRPIPLPGVVSRSFPAQDPGRVIRQEVVRTSPSGEATLEVQTPVDSPTDLLYTIEARVTDAVGREVVRSTELIVARQSYFVDMTAENRVVLPGDPVTIDVQVRDPNGSPISADGVITVTREEWTEVWVDPNGREVSGAELDRLRQGVFPPPDAPGWHPIRREYVKEEVSRTSVSIGKSGNLIFKFKPSQTGYYRIEWLGPDNDGPPVVSQTQLWAVSADSRIVRYHASGVEIIVDAQVESGQKTLPVLVATSISNRDVLFTVHADDTLFDARLIRIEGDASLVELPIQEGLVPNIYLSASLVENLQFHTTTAEVTIPPTRNRLNVEVEAKDPKILPGTTSSIELRLTDSDGKPVVGEVALSVADEALHSIQQRYSVDPLEFFFGNLRLNDSVPVSSVQRSPFRLNEARRTAMVFSSREPHLREEIFNEMPGEAASSLGARLMLTDSAPAEGKAGEAPGESVQVRSDFRSTAFWQPNIETDEEGRATVSVRYPDSLTTWIGAATAVGTGAQFGEGQVSVQTTKPLVARLQSPRFLVAGDSAVVTGGVTNRSSGELETKLTLSLEGLGGEMEPRSVSVAPGLTATTTWPVSAQGAGEAKLTLTAIAGDLNDGLQVKLPIVENGLEVQDHSAGKAIDSSATIKIDLPAERRDGGETFQINVTASLAATALDALPHLVEYPYGCVEQTMSRFLPAVVTAKTLADLGLEPEQVAGRIFGGVDAAMLPRMAADSSKIDVLDEVVAAGVARLVEMQRTDGAWSWWPEGEADALMTAYVLWGLREAGSAGAEVPEKTLTGATNWLNLELVNANDRLDVQSWMLFALASGREANEATTAEQAAALENLWSRRDGLSSYGLALLTLSAHSFGDSAKSEVLARNLINGVKRDAQPGLSPATGTGSISQQALATAHWGEEQFLRWEASGTEATAFAVQALLTTNPTSELIGPAVNWLVQNRRGAAWSNTRDTAVTILALNRYLSSTGELGKPVSFEVKVNGSTVASVNNATPLTGQSVIDVDRGLLRSGVNEIEIRRTSGDSPLYYSATATYFSKEQPIPSHGNVVFVRRDYSFFRPQLTLLDGYRYDRIPWAVDAQASPNDRVEVELTVECKNDVEYLVIEDNKPAGLEAVESLSGPTLFAEHEDGTQVGIYCELRDQKVALFAHHLKQGVWKIRYDLRAETPGDFTALPAVSHAMYVPDIRGNSTSRRVQIQARGE